MILILKVYVKNFIKDIKISIKYRKVEFAGKFYRL